MTRATSPCRSANCKQGFGSVAERLQALCLTRVLARQVQRPPFVWFFSLHLRWPLVRENPGPTGGGPWRRFGRQQYWRQQGRGVHRHHLGETRRAPSQERAGDPHVW